tara:strand:- start:410 stop:595 length:186 start_codon:yes stop_codon:yes gene_type:complete
MFGKLLSTVVKTVTIPIDVIESTLDVGFGGDGSKESIDSADIPRPSTLRDAICDRIEEIDD